MTSCCGVADCSTVDDQLLWHQQRRLSLARKHPAISTLMHCGYSRHVVTYTQAHSDTRSCHANPAPEDFSQLVTSLCWSLWRHHSLLVLIASPFSSCPYSVTIPCWSLCCHYSLLVIIVSSVSVVPVCMMSDGSEHKPSSAVQCPHGMLSQSLTVLLESYSTPQDNRGIETSRQQLWCVTT